MGPRLLERETELRELAAVFEDVLAGRGRTIVLEGAAGAGKSALTAAASERAKGAGLRVLCARGSELERQYAFGAVRQLFEPILETVTPEERRRLLAGAARSAAWVLSPDPSASSERAAAGFAVLNGIYWLTTNLAEEQPVLLVVDDAHWADLSSLRALNFLAGRVADAPIVLLATLRPAEPGAPMHLLDELRTQPSALRVTLGPLGAASVARIVRDRISPVDEGICDACHVASAGNPLYLQELLRTVAADGLLTAPDPAAAVHDASVPSLGDRVVRRIAALAPEASALTSAMAVLGDGGRLEMAATLAGVDPVEAGRIAHGLRGIEVVAAEDPFWFVHPLVRRSVYDHLSDREKQVAHARAAKLLREAGAAAEAVASHLAAVPPNGSTEVAATLVEAGELALTRAAPDEAVRWFRRALEEGAAEPPAAVILAQMGMTEVALRDAASIGHLHEALERAEDLQLRTRVAVALAEILAQAGHWQAALATADAAEQQVTGGPRGLVTEVAAIKAALTAYDPERVDEFERNRPRLRELAAGDGWAAHALAAMLAAAVAVRGEGRDDAMALADRALQDGRLLSERGAGAWASAQLLSAMVYAEAYARAESAAGLVLEAGRRDGTLLGVLTGLGYGGWIQALRGDLPSAEVKLRTALSMAMDAGMPMINVTGFYFLQDAILERPSLDDVAALVEATELDPVFRTTWTGAMLLDVRGRLRLARRDREGGIDDLRTVGAIAVGLRMGASVSSWRSTIALALPTQQSEEAAELIAEELELARLAGLARPHAIALRAAGMLERGERGLELLRESVSLLADSEARLEHARSLIELGSALRRVQQRTEARQQLAVGMELAHRCGAERLTARAQEELRAAGARPRRTQRSGRDALTASQLRVARLAAGGATNPQIAQELYVSLKTVETHLSHAYAKLGLSGQGSRARLAEALEEPASTGGSATGARDGRDQERRNASRASTRR